MKIINKTACYFMAAGFLYLGGNVILAEPENTDTALLIPYASCEVKIDGDLSDACWKDALQVSTFIQNGGEPPEAETRAYLMFDEKHLYIGFQCQEPNIGKLRKHSRERDDEVFSDDCVEAFIDPSGSGLNYIHIGLNPNNALWDGIHATDLTPDPEWNADGILSGAQILTDSWTAEIAVPFKDLGVSPIANEVWKINLGRERRAGSKEEYSSLTGTFCDGAMFVSIVFDMKDKPSNAIKLQVINRGGLSRKGNDLGKNRFEMVLGGQDSGAGTVNIGVFSIQKGRRTPLAQATADADSSAKKLSYAYNVSGVPGEEIEFVVSDAGEKVLYNQKYRAHGSAGSRFKEIENPLYAELLSDEDPGLTREGVLLWPSQIFLRGLKGGPLPFCLRYGIPVDAELAYMDLADHALISVNSAVLLRNYRFPEFARRLGARACVWPVSPKAYKVDPEAWLFADTWLEKYKESVLDIARHGFVWAVFWGDEMRETTLKQGVRIYEGRGEKKRQEWMRTVIESEVKEKFGFGKYGMPQGQDDTDPFRWIAWCRYINYRERNLFKELRAEARKIAPDIRFLSEDPNAALCPFEFSAEADMAVHDVFTHQTNTRNFGFMSKFLADLTGGEVWPVVHCEHYLMSSTPENVREMFSAVFRNGGTGLHLYPTDSTQGKNNVFCTEFSSPPRWNAMMEIADRVRRQNKLKFPKADCGLFYSNPSHQAISPFKEWTGNEAAALYDFLGPQGIKSWFRFVDENIIVNHKDALDGFRAIFVPFAKYLGKDEVASLEKYVADGGALVCLDPNGFSWNIDGAELKTQREKLFGVKGVSATETERWFKIKDDKFARGTPAGAILPVFADIYRLDISPDTEVLAEFSDGSPAITQKHLNKGRALFFAVNPLNQTSVKSADWLKFFRDLGGTLGINMDREIWRFKFPPFEREIYPPDPRGKCLTDNYMKFQEDVPLYVKNVDTQGSYSYSLAPDVWSDQGGVTDVPFEKGSLTNRKKAFDFNGQKEEPEKWAVRWKANEAMDIIFDLKKEYSVKRAQLFYSGELPTFTIAGSTDAKEWQEVGRRDVGGNTDGVRNAEVTLNPGSYRHIKVHFEKRKDNKELVLAEMEIWGE